MAFYFNTESITEENILSLIKNEIEESINLDFKAGEALDKSENKKNEISKDISAFANSAGGTIVYGIAEENHKAGALSFINGNDYTKEWLEQVIQSRIVRKIDGIKIVPVRFEGDIQKSIYVVYVPESTHAPHMAFDKRYYKRYNFESLRMEEYEVRQLYNRSVKTELRREAVLIAPHSSSSSANFISHVEYSLRFQVKNIGSAIENHYKVEISIPEGVYSGSDLSSNPIRAFLIRKDGPYSIFSVPNTSPLFQNELTTIATCHIRVDKGGFIQLSSTPLVIKLYYSNGFDESEMDLTKHLSFAGGLLTLDRFK